MTDMHIPQHIDMTRRIAAQETASVTALTVQEQQLTAEYDRHQAEYEAEQKRLDAELREAAEKAREHLNRLAEVGKRINGQVQDIGLRLQKHRHEATDAQQTVADWCTRHGVNPADLPPLPDTGPLPVVAAPVPKAPSSVDLTDDGMHCPTCESPEPRLHPAVSGGGEVTQICTDPFHVPGDDAPDLPTRGPKLPALDAPEALLEAGRRAADPNATQVDGGDEPEQGRFQEGRDA